MHKHGMSYGEIAAVAHCSRQRIHQIVKYKKRRFIHRILGYKVTIERDGE